VTQTPSGWYPDPTPSRPDLGPSLRWWDGAQWTEHVATAPPATYPAQPYPAQSAQTYPAQTYPAQTYPAQAYPNQGYAGPAPATTPDGQPLAGWWQRVGAAVIDFLITFPVSILVGLPFLIPMASAFADEWEQAMDEIDSGGGPAAFGAGFQNEIVWYALGFGIVTLLVGAIYEIGFLRWKQATPGKMVLGLQVRLRERPGTLTWGCLFLRWFVKRLGSILGQIPLIGGLLNIAWLINFLWPLWDDKKQALHDKAAGTNVVRVR
jgi:uncharacterized RDD family membrane protein YckC